MWRVACDGRAVMRRGPRGGAWRLARALAAAVLPAVAGGCVAVADAAPTDAGARHAPRATRHAPALTIARIQYDGGGDWYANPSSLPNLLRAVRERTTLRVAPTEARVRLTDPRLAEYPMLHLTGHGEVKLTDAEVAALRAYLLGGGFLHADDNYGLDASVRRELARVFPDRPLVEVPRTHAIYSVVYPFPGGLPKIHEHDGKPPRGYGIFVGPRLAVFYSHESDLGNGWEDVGTYPNDPPALHEQALRMGVNLFVYAVTSRVE